MIPPCVDARASNMADRRERKMTRILRDAGDMERGLTGEGHSRRKSFAPLTKRGARPPAKEMSRG